MVGKRGIGETLATLPLTAASAHCLPALRCLLPDFPRREEIMHRKTVVVSMVALFSLVTVNAFADKAEVKGMITSRAGDTMIVESAAGNVTVVLTDQTRTKDDKGLFGLEKQEMGETVLIPGLKVDI